MPQLVELLSQETLATILLRSESGLTLMSVCTRRKTPLAVCSLQAFNLHMPGKQGEVPARSPSQFFSLVIEMKICTLGILTYLTCILSQAPALARSPCTYTFPQTQTSFGFPAFRNISTAMEPHSRYVLEAIVWISVSVGAPGGVDCN